MARAGVCQSHCVGRLKGPRKKYGFLFFLTRASGGRRPPERLPEPSLGPSGPSGPGPTSEDPYLLRPRRGWVDGGSRKPPGARLVRVARLGMCQSHVGGPTQ